MATKRVTHNAEFMAAAAADTDGALAYMLMAAFGVSLAELIDIAESIISVRDFSVLSMAMAASVQIRGNVVFVGDDYADLKNKYPALIIEGARAQDDTFNFSALHCLGHILAHWSGHPIGQKVLKKAGSCITGQDTTKNQAGEINSDIARGWAPDDLMRFQNILMSQRHAPLLKAMFDELVSKAAGFKAKIKPPLPGSGAAMAGSSSLAAETSAKSGKSAKSTAPGT